MANSEKNSKQVMDVSKPGKTAANATTRPIIVGHKPMVQDSMVNTPEDDNPDAPKKEPTSAINPVGKRVIAPIPEPEKPTTEKPEVNAEKVQTAEKEPETELAKSQEASDDESSDAAVVDAVADQVGVKKKEEQALEEDKKKQAPIAKLVAEKKYFVPIGKAHKKSRSFAAVIILIVLLTVVGGVVAIDAGIVDVGINLPIDLIK